MQTKTLKPEIATKLDPQLAAAVPRLDEYFGCWAIHETTFRAGLAQINQLDLAAHIRLQVEKSSGQPEARSREPFQRNGSVAVIELSGTLMKQESSLYYSTSTVRARQAVRAAAGDESVTAIMLHVESPGGTVAGTKELADEVAAARQRKPVHAFIEDLGTSAAYWVASQAQRITVNQTGAVGSIGTFFFIEDFSEQNKLLGVKAHLIVAEGGEQFKGAGVEGTEITDAQLNEWQRLVNELNEHFLAGVQAGRGWTKSQTRELADGRVHIGKTAKSMGLVDAVGTFDEALAKLTPKQRSTRSMAENQPTPEVTDDVDVVATYSEIKAACPGAEAEWIGGQCEKHVTVEQAKDNWMAEQRKRLDDAQAAAKRPGQDPLGESGDAGGDAAGGDAIEQFEAAVAAEVKKGLPKAKAVSKVVAEQSELHDAYLAAYNAKHGRPVPA